MVDSRFLEKGIMKKLAFNSKREVDGMVGGGKQ